MPAARGKPNVLGGADSTGPRRSGLLQERSRETRRQLVRAALALWNERGFEHGIEDTTAEEIARAAGVTKGTFYFHFAHKEDILLEIGWGVAEAMVAEAQVQIRRGRPTREIIDRLLASLARRVERAPRAAVIRSAMEFARRSHDRFVRPEGAVSFLDPFEAVVGYAIDRGELPSGVDPRELAELLQTVTTDTLLRWALEGKGSLRNALQQRAAVVIAGTAAVFAGTAWDGLAASSGG